LGIEVACNSQGLFLAQRKYALEIVNKCSLLGIEPTNLPMAASHELALATGMFLDDPTSYKRLVGSLYI